MEALKITSASIYNNCTGKLSILLSNKKSMTANLIHSDLVKWLKKEVSTSDLVNKYFCIKGQTCNYVNPKK